ncbi:MAG: aminoacetone oxidase family FAD-binding enzyme [Acholeplasmataceae bacterium]|nr:aminoacetone oxidase family FAD-binding enzyme [Acholeplasmataceae bacterium]
MKRKIIIIGGGASGIACALRMKMRNPELDCLILEQNPRIGKKILKTGNGKCNISNLRMASEHYNQPDFIARCLESFSVNDLVEFFRRLGLLLRADAAERLYPHSEYANTVLEVLLQALSKYRIEVLCNQRVREIQQGDGFEILTEDSRFFSDVLVIATGSLAQEKTNGYELLGNLGHSLTPLEPGLVALATKENMSSLRGIRVKCRAKLLDRGKIIHEESGEILFKEKGLSGILALNLSRHARPGNIVSLDLFPDVDILRFLEEALAEKSMDEALLGILPKMLAHEVLKRNINHDLQAIHATLRGLTFEITGKFGYEFAQITLGGVRIEEINHDFSSKKNQDLYVIGEILDVDGGCGGYNLHFAWMSGILAADAIADRFEKNL